MHHPSAETNLGTFSGPPHTNPSRCCKASPSTTRRPLPTSTSVVGHVMIGALKRRTNRRPAIPTWNQSGLSLTQISSFRTDQLNAPQPHNRRTDGQTKPHSSAGFETSGFFLSIIIKSLSPRRDRPSRPMLIRRPSSAPPNSRQETHKERSMPTWDSFDRRSTARILELFDVSIYGTVVSSACHLVVHII